MAKVTSSDIALRIRTDVRRALENLVRDLASGGSGSNAADNASEDLSRAIGEAIVFAIDEEHPS